MHLTLIRCTTTRPVPMNILNCAPNAWLPFEDPIVTPSEQDILLSKFLERVNSVGSKYDLTDFETSPWNLSWILKNSNSDIETAYTSWLSWIEWRREWKCDQITDEDVSRERDSGIAIWRGHDKLGRPCLLITGRMLDLENIRVQGFKKFLIKAIEDGIKKLDKDNIERMKRREARNQPDLETEIMHRGDTSDKLEKDLIVPNDTVINEICIIYDRRGLEYQHISSTLYTVTRNLVNDIRTHYGSRLGALYVVHTNIFFWSLYHIFLRPIMMLFAKEGKVIIVEKAEELIAYFEEDQILLISPSESAQTRRRPAIEDQQSLNSDETKPNSTGSIAALNR